MTEESENENEDEKRKRMHARACPRNDAHAYRSHGVSGTHQDQIIQLLTIVTNLHTATQAQDTTHQHNKTKQHTSHHMQAQEPWCSAHTTRSMVIHKSTHRSTEAQKHTSTHSSTIQYTHVTLDAIMHRTHLVDVIGIPGILTYITQHLHTANKASEHACTERCKMYMMKRCCLA